MAATPNLHPLFSQKLYLGRNATGNASILPGTKQEEKKAGKGLGG